MKASLLGVGAHTGPSLPPPEEPSCARDFRIDHLPGDDFGRVSLAMDGRRVLLNYVLKEAEAVVELLHRRDKGTNAAVVDGPGAP